MWINHSDTLRKSDRKRPHWAFVRAVSINPRKALRILDRCAGEQQEKELVEAYDRCAWVPGCRPAHLTALMSGSFSKELVDRLARLSPPLLDTSVVCTWCRSVTVRKAVGTWWFDTHWRQLNVRSPHQLNAISAHTHGPSACAHTWRQSPFATSRHAELWDKLGLVRGCECGEVSEVPFVSILYCEKCNLML